MTEGDGGERHHNMEQYVWQYNPVTSYMAVHQFIQELMTGQ